MKKCVCAVFFVLFIIFLFSCLSYAEYYDGIFIVVNNDAVSFNDYMNNYIKTRNWLIKMSQPIPKNLKVSVFQNLINEKLIQQIAEKKEIFVSDSEIDESIDRMKKINHLSDSAFNQVLTEQGQSLQELRAEQKKQFLREKILEIELQPRIKHPTEEELKDYYNKHKSEMYEPTKIRVSHILIKDNPNASLDARSKIKQKAQMILDKALKGENFEKLAKTYSEDDSSASIGGDIGFIAPGEWLQELNNVVFKLNVGQIAPQILQSRLGWHIVKVTSQKNKQLVSFNDMKSRIENYLVQKRMQEEFENWIKDKMKEAYIEVVFPDKEKYDYDYGQWKKKDTTTVISSDAFYKKVDSLAL